MPGPSRRLTATTARDLVEQESFTPTGTGRVGIELEFLVFRESDRQAPPSADLLAAVGDATFPGGSGVSFEPGGQVELSGPPCDDVGAACTAMADDITVLRDAVAEHGAELVATGLDRIRRPRRVLHSPRYEAMEAFFDTDGPAGRSMMCSTASIQVNLDLAGPGNADGRWELAHSISPVLVAAFANSARLANWWAIDPSRTAPCDTESWVDYALNARLMLVRLDEHHYVAQVDRMSFADWIEHGHPLGWPDEDDLSYHLTTLFPPVRPRGWLELRVIDALPDPWWRVAVAVATALLDDPEAADTARHATAATAGLWLEATHEGLANPLLATAARHCFAAALDALPRIGADKVTVDATAEFLDRHIERGVPWT